MGERAAGSMRVPVRVRPRSSRVRVGGRYRDGELVVAVREPAVDGRATQAVIKALADVLRGVTLPGRTGERGHEPQQALRARRGRGGPDAAAPGTSRRVRLPGSRSLWSLLVVVLVAANLRPAVVAVSPVLGRIRDEFGLSATAAGLLTTIPVLCFGALAPAAARLAAPTRAGRRHGGRRRRPRRRIVRPARSRRCPPVRRHRADRRGHRDRQRRRPRGRQARLPAPDRARDGTVFRGALRRGGRRRGTDGPAGRGDRRLADRPRLLGACLALALLPLVVAWAARGGHVRALPSPGGAAAGGGLWRDRLAWQVTAFMGLQSFVFYATTAWIPQILVDRGDGRGARRMAAVRRGARGPGVLAVRPRPGDARAGPGRLGPGVVRLLRGRAARAAGRRGPGRLRARPRSRPGRRAGARADVLRRPLPEHRGDDAAVRHGADRRLPLRGARPAGDGLAARHHGRLGGSARPSRPPRPASDGLRRARRPRPLRRGPRRRSGYCT